MVFTYTARDTSGKVVTDVMDAKDSHELLEKLRQKRLVVTKVVQGASSGSAKKGGKLFGRRRGRVKMDDVIVFSRQLATMIESGLPLVHSLEVLMRQARTITFGEILQSIKDDVEVSGLPLSTALSKYPNVFSGLFINMAKAGEMSGTLDSTLTQLANYLESSGAITKKIKSAMIYPILIGITSVPL